MEGRRVRQVAESKGCRSTAASGTTLEFNAIDINANNVTVAGNFLGIQADGTTVAANVTGVNVAAGVTGAVIGTRGPGRPEPHLGQLLLGHRDRGHQCLGPGQPDRHGQDRGPKPNGYSGQPASA